MVIGGSCPHCGAAIYYASPWMAVIPPPPQYTCTCRLAASTPSFPFGPQIPPTDTACPGGFDMGVVLTDSTRIHYA